METARTSQADRPQNGIPGLKFWRDDLLSGLQVALLGLPLSLGIAMASGAPPVAGAISAIIAGFVFPFLGGAHITIAGPAVGLAPALLAGTYVLGQGNLEVGYPLVLVAVCLSGALQLLLSTYDAGRLAMYFPSSVLRGMLMAIGMLVIIQQLPALLGHQAPYTNDILDALGRLPNQIMTLNPKVSAVGAVALTLLFTIHSRRIREQPWTTIIPGPLLIVMWGGIAGWFLQLPPEYLISVPDEILMQGVHFPNFTSAWLHRELWFSLLISVVILTLINTTESLATILAIDKIDPFNRRSDPNITLRTMGVSTLLSGLVGGLMVIPGGIKSTANMLAGGKTLWANMYYAVFMVIILWFGSALINRIPLAVLAALLIFVGWELCNPSSVLRILKVGKEQLVVALACVIVTLFTSNLLLGILLGIMTKVVFLCRDVVMTLAFDSRLRPITHDSFYACLIESLKELFRDPVIRIGDGRISSEPSPIISESGNHVHHPYKVYLSSISCMNILRLDARLRELLAHIPPKHTVMLILRGHVVDHTAMEYLYYLQQCCFQEGYDCILVGGEYFVPRSTHALAYRVNHTHENAA